MKCGVRIIVSGLVGRYPLGGVAWDYFQYLIGLARLGYDVVYYEDTRAWPYEPVQRTYTADGRYSAKFIAEFFERFAPELKTRWHYYHLGHTGFGMGKTAVAEVARTADLFLNVSGVSTFPDELSPGCVKVFLDTDPGSNQIALSNLFARSKDLDPWYALIAGHDRFFTYAENIHSPECRVPKMGFNWQTTRMPVVLDLWQQFASARPPAEAPWTTVMTWNAFRKKLLYEGVEYGSKDVEFERLLDLPSNVKVRLAVALGGLDAPRSRLVNAGWEVVDGPFTTLTPGQYQTFIAGSRGEFSPAKQVYVAMRTGWFSCRSACYLAAARPVVVQDTGFGEILPTGEGILTFRDIYEAVWALQVVEADYEKHARAAQELAAECFGSDRVLRRLVNDAFDSQLA